jgi:hypothetical protein
LRVKIKKSLIGTWTDRTDQIEIEKNDTINDYIIVNESEFKLRTKHKTKTKLQNQKKLQKSIHERYYSYEFVFSLIN